jgi:hypothetical protein
VSMLQSLRRYPMTTAERNSIREAERDRIVSPRIGGYPLTAAERNSIYSHLPLLVDGACVFLSRNNPKMALKNISSALYLSHRVSIPLLPEDKTQWRFCEWTSWLRSHLFNACGYLELNKPKKALEQLRLAGQVAQKLSPHPSQPALFPMLISELTEEERKSMEEWIRRLSIVFRLCDSRLLHYGTGEENVLKLLQDMNMVGAVISDARSELLKAHKIPNSLYPWLSPKES